MSEPTVVQALAAVMNEIKVVRKEERNQAQNFSFRGIDAVLNAVGPALRKHGVVVVPEVLDYTYDTVVTSRGTSMAHVVVKVAYTFYGPAGDDLSCMVIGESMDTGDKAGAKAMSVAFRTALLQSLALPTDEPDPDSESYERAAPKKKTAKAPAKEEQPQASPGQVSGLVDEFAACEDSDALAGIAQKVAALSVSDTDRDILRSAYTQAKERLQAT